MKPRELETPGVLLMKPVISLEGGKQDCATISELSKGAFPSLRTHLTLSGKNRKFKFVCLEVERSMCSYRLEVELFVGWRELSMAKIDEEVKYH